MKFEKWYETGMGTGYFVLYGDRLSGSTYLRIEPESGGHIVDYQTKQKKGSFFFIQDQGIDQLEELVSLVDAFHNPEISITQLHNGEHPKFMMDLK